MIALCAVDLLCNLNMTAWVILNRNTFGALAAALMIKHMSAMLYGIH